MKRLDAFCQSCGMPMEQDPGKGGTEADGSKSTMYCSLCYDQGRFRDHFTRPEEMVSFVRGKLKEMGFGAIKRWLFTLHIPKLARWSQGR